MQQSVRPWEGMLTNAETPFPLLLPFFINSHSPSSAYTCAQWIHTQIPYRLPSTSLTQVSQGPAMSKKTSLSLG